MTIGVLASQSAAELTTLVTLLFSLGLSVAISVRYARRRNSSMMFWSIGLWLFTFGALLELMFAVDVYSEGLAKLYLLVVAVLVEFLALGSIQFSRSVRIRNWYYLFVILSTVFMAYSLLVTSVSNMVVNYVVAVSPPMLVIVASSLMTIPASIILVVFAYKAYKARKDPRLLSIIAGVIIVGIAGGLYIAQYPSFLYIAEVAGILLLWYGFF